MVRVEDGVREEVARAGQGCWERKCGFAQELVGVERPALADGGACGEDLEQVSDFRPRRRLVEGDAQCAVAEVPQVHVPLTCGLKHALCRSARTNADRVKEHLVEHRVPEPLEAQGQDRHVPVHALSDLLEAVGTVVPGVEPSHHRKQGLGRADVARSLLSPDVLFARLDRHAVRRVALSILC